MSATNKTWTNNSPPQLEDDDLNGFKLENNNLITASGQLLSTADRQQTNKAVAHYAAGGGTYFIDSGAANAYTLAAGGSRVAPPAYFAGFTAVFVPANDNTGASTVNVGGLGVKDVSRVYGQNVPVLPGQLSGLVTLIYDGAQFYVIASGASGGVLQSPGVDIVTTSGAYTVPANVFEIEVYMVAGGGGGGGGCKYGPVQHIAGGGGGGCGGAVRFKLKVTPGQALTCTIGAAGVAGTAADTSVPSPGGVASIGGAGGDTSITEAAGIVCKGGQGGRPSPYNNDSDEGGSQLVAENIQGGDGGEVEITAPLAAGISDLFAFRGSQGKPAALGVIVGSYGEDNARTSEGGSGGTSPMVIGFGADVERGRGGKGGNTDTQTETTWQAKSGKAGAIVFKY